MRLAPGTRLGPYEILAPLGAGGMGEVYRARDARLGREVALKVLPAELSRDPERLARFEQEARAASALNHPNIVTVHDIGVSDSISWIAMERVEGKSLRELMAAAPLPVKRILLLATQIVEGLARAHAGAIVHRDLKPENVMVSEDGFIKILDFGLAKLAPPRAEELTSAPTAAMEAPRTQTGMILGTVGYDLSRNTPTRLTSDPTHENRPVWSPDGGRIIFRSDRNGPPDLYEIPSAGGAVRLFLERPGGQMPEDFSPDRETFCFRNRTGRRETISGCCPFPERVGPFPFFRRASRSRTDASRPTAAGSPTTPTSRETSRFTCRRAREAARGPVSRPPAASPPAGGATAGNSSISRRAEG